MQGRSWDLLKSDGEVEEWTARGKENWPNDDAFNLFVCLRSNSTTFVRIQAMKGEAYKHKLPWRPLG